MKRRSIDNLQDAGRTAVLDGSVENFGYRLLGPYLVSFCAWLKQQKQDIHPDACLLFVARDGYLPYIVYRGVYPEDESASFYVLASRISARLALNDETQAVGSPALDLLTRLYSHGKIRTSPSKIAGTFPDSYGRYLNDIIGDRFPIIVDIGYRAGTQAAFARLLRRKVGGLYFVTHASAGPVATSAGPIRAFDAHLVPPQSMDSFVNRHRYFFETLLAAPTGTFLFFDADGNAVHEDVSMDSGSAALTSAIRRGVRRYVRHDGKAAASTFGLAEREAVSRLTHFLNDPHADDAALFAGLSFDDSLQGVSRRYLVTPPLERRNNYALWVEGQNAIDRTSRDRSPPQIVGLRVHCEAKLMRLCLTNAQFACFSTNRQLYVSENGGLLNTYRSAVLRLLWRTIRRWFGPS